MAVKTYATGDPEVVKLWSKRLARETLKKTVCYPYIKDSGDALCTLETDTQKGPGDRVTVTLRMQLSGDGVTENETQEGNEEAITTYTDNLYINELSHAFRHKTKMAQQRVPFKLAKEGNDGLSDWHAARMDQIFFNHLCGYTVANTPAPGLGGPKYNGFNTITAPSSGRQLWTEAAASTDEALDSSGDELTLNMIDRAKELAETGGSAGLVPIRPVSGLPSGAKYVCFVHPTQVTSLRASTSTNNWMDLQKSWLQGGKGEDSMIWKGGLGVYNEVLLVSANRVTKGVHSSTGLKIDTVRRAVFCGAQSLISAYGQGFGPEQWEVNEETFDFKRQYAANGLNIFGFKKSVFNSSDFATIVISSYAADAA
jgi:N4-gp56 family major capsid protein